MRHRLPSLAALLLVGLALPAEARADEPRPVEVVTKEAPPFVMKDAEGRWSGLAVELFEAAAQEAGLAPTWREATLEEMLDAVSTGAADVAVGALTVTPEREERFDFTQPWYPAGLGIAVPARPAGGLASTLRRIVSGPFVQALLTLLGLLLAVGFVVWLLERRRNAEQFGGRAAEGIGAGFWWSAVTMTTVGYGDKAPRTFAGRAVAFVWMFASLVLVATLTGAIASALTVSELETSIRGPDDLSGRLVGTVRASASASWLADRGIPRRAYASMDEAMRALGRGEVEAVVHDRPLLRWWLAQGGAAAEGLTVLPTTFEDRAYAFGLPSGSDLREPLNRAILRHLDGAAWKASLARYLGG